MSPLLLLLLLCSPRRLRLYLALNAQMVEFARIVKQRDEDEKAAIEAKKKKKSITKAATQPS